MGPPKMLAKRLKMTVNRERVKQFIPLKTGYFFYNFVHFLQFALFSGKMAIKLSGLETWDCADHENNLQNGYSPINGLPMSLWLWPSHSLTNSHVLLSKIPSQSVPVHGDQIQLLCHYQSIHPKKLLCCLSLTLFHWITVPFALKSMEKSYLANGTFLTRV